MELVKFWEYDKESRTPFLVLGAHSLLGEQTGKRQFQPPSFSSYVGETFLLLVILCFWLLQQGVCLLPQQPPKCCLFSSFFRMPFAPGYWLWGLLRFLLKHLPSSLCSLLLDNTIYSQGLHYYIYINNSGIWISTFTSQLSSKSVFTPNPWMVRYMNSTWSNFDS